MRNVAILVDGAFYLKRLQKYLKQTQTPKQVADGLLTHCLKHIYLEFTS